MKWKILGAVKVIQSSKALPPSLCSVFVDLKVARYVVNVVIELISVAMPFSACMRENTQADTWRWFGEASITSGSLLFYCLLWRCFFSHLPDDAFHWFACKWVNFSLEECWQRKWNPGVDWLVEHYLPSVITSDIKLPFNHIFFLWILWLEALYLIKCGPVLFS